MKEIILAIVILLLWGCQTYTETRTEYYENGQLKSETIIKKEGIPDWSEGKQFNGSAI